MAYERAVMNRNTITISRDEWPNKSPSIKATGIAFLLPNIAILLKKYLKKEVFPLKK